MERDINAELKQAQAAVKLLNQQREKLLSDQGREEQRFADAIEALEKLGIQGVKEMSVEQIEELRAKAQEQLAQALDGMQKQIAAAQTVLREYEEVK